MLTSPEEGSAPAATSAGICASAQQASGQVVRPLFQMMGEPGHLSHHRYATRIAANSLVRCYFAIAVAPRLPGSSTRPRGRPPLVAVSVRLQLKFALLIGALGKPSASDQSHISAPAPDKRRSRGYGCVRLVVAILYVEADRRSESYLACQARKQKRGASRTSATLEFKQPLRLL
jgi:hypothetical protein